MLHQPAILLRAGLELRHRAEIDQRRIDALAARNAIERFLRSETDADVLDIDDGAVMHLKRVFCFQLGKAVGTDHLEIRAGGKDGAAHVWSMHLAAENRDDSPYTPADVAGDDRRADVDDE